MCASSYIIYLVVGIKEVGVQKEKKKQKEKRDKKQKVPNQKKEKKETPLAIFCRKAQAR